MAIIEALKNYFMSYAAMSEMTPYVDALDFKTGSVSFESTPDDSPIIKRYLDGSTERKYTFVIAFEFDYSEEFQQTMDNCGFFEDLQAWLEEQVADDNLPALNAGQQATDLQALTHGYIYDIASDMQRARYQIQCKLTYDQE